MHKQAIVIHGLGRTALAMRSLARELGSNGYQVTNLDYPSTRMPIESLVVRYLVPEFERAAALGPVYVVTHSLGGILLRYYLAHHLNPQVKDKLQRVVMLAPPNQGSGIPDQLKQWAVARWILGPVMPQLGTDSESIPNALQRLEQGAFPCDIGIIAGTRSYEPWFAPFLKGQSDGKVTVESTRLQGMKDFIALEVGHTFIMEDKTVWQQVLHFLGQGEFKH